VDLDRVNGKRRQKRIRFEAHITTKKKAEAELARTVTEINGGEFLPSSFRFAGEFPEPPSAGK
jgi:hypothetical protein